LSPLSGGSRLARAILRKRSWPRGCLSRLHQTDRSRRQNPQKASPRHDDPGIDIAIPEEGGRRVLPVPSRLRERTLSYPRAIRGGVSRSPSASVPCAVARDCKVRRAGIAQRAIKREAPRWVPTVSIRSIRRAGLTSVSRRGSGRHSSECLFYLCHAYLTARAAVSITRATARGWEMWTAWLALSTVTFDPARLAIHRASSGLSARSSVATMA
jgi:hypothetical protein